MAKAKAAQPPRAWIAAEPAKSFMPSCASQPSPFQIQCPEIGYRIAATNAATKIYAL
ncbi:hypothetical protein D3C73_1366960 [compost metagenome]